MWQPIDTAPKDGTQLLLWTGHIHIGRWEANEYAKKPKPFWRYSYLFGVTSQRQRQPTHWMPLPKPPNADSH